jgi:translation initiation factor IF-3
VRLIDHDGAQLGIVPIEEARRRAEELALDLVEVGPTADPPVVKIQDWGKVKFERDKRAREAKKKQTQIEIKEVKYRPTIDPHDFDIKTRRAEKFLYDGKKVKVTIFFRFRQLRRPELGSQILDKVVQELEPIAEIETRSRLEGRQMVMVLAPKPGVKKPKKAKPPEAEAKAKVTEAKAKVAPPELTSSEAESRDTQPKAVIETEPKAKKDSVEKPKKDSAAKPKKGAKPEATAEQPPEAEPKPKAVKEKAAKAPKARAS